MHVWLEAAALQLARAAPTTYASRLKLPRASPQSPATSQPTPQSFRPSPPGRPSRPRAASAPPAPARWRPSGERARRPARAAPTSRAISGESRPISGDLDDGLARRGTSSSIGLTRKRCVTKERSRPTGELQEGSENKAPRRCVLEGEVERRAPPSLEAMCACSSRMTPNTAVFKGERGENQRQRRKGLMLRERGILRCCTTV